MLIGQFIQLVVILVTTIQNKYHVTYKSTVLGPLIYAVVIGGLVVYSLVGHVVAPSG